MNTIHELSVLEVVPEQIHLIFVNENFKNL